MFVCNPNAEQFSLTGPLAELARVSTHNQLHRIEGRKRVVNKLEKEHCADCKPNLYAGDIGYVDEKGHLFIVDRLKELIKVKGLQVAPAELEDILLSHKEISDAAVIGVPDEKSGEKPRAYVVRANNELTEAQVKHFIEEKVSSYKFLTGGVIFVSEIPKSPSGKILRRFLRDQAAKELSKL